MLLDASSSTGDPGPARCVDPDRPRPLRPLRVPALLVLLLALPSACVPAPAGDDDDDPAADDDDAPACGDSSEGAGGAVAPTWMEVPGTSVGGDSAEYAIFVLPPPNPAPATGYPLLIPIGRRMPPTRAENETILVDFLGLDSLGDFGFLVATALPGPAGNGINWTDSPADAAYFDDAVDALEAAYPIDRDRIYLWGSSAGATASVFLGWTHAARVAGIAMHAGRNPWNGDAPGPFEGSVAGWFVHGPEDDIVTEEATESAAAAWEAGGQRTERWFDYPNDHEWIGEVANAPMTEFFATVCNR